MQRSYYKNFHPTLLLFLIIRQFNDNVCCTSRQKYFTRFPRAVCCATACRVPRPDKFQRGLGVRRLRGPTVLSAARAVDRCDGVNKSKLAIINSGPTTSPPTFFPLSPPPPPPPRPLCVSVLRLAARPRRWELEVGHSEGRQGLRRCSRL